VLPARSLIAAACSALTLAALAAPAAAQTTSGQSGTPGVTLPGATTTTTAPATTTTTAPPAGSRSTPTTATTKPPAKKGGVPPVPVGGPPTTVPKPGTPPAPQPSVTPILVQVDADLAQLSAINEYQPAQQLVARAQGAVVTAGAALLTARQTLDRANAAAAAAGANKLTADQKLRQLALAAYVGLSYTTPGLNQPAGGNGDQGSGTVSTPGGLTGIQAIDAQEMLLLVGQHARQSDTDAVHQLAQARAVAKAAITEYKREQAAVGVAEARLLAAQQALKQVATAAVTPGAAAASPLPNLTALVKGTATATATAGAQTTGLAPLGAGGPTPTAPDILSHPVLNAAELKAWWATQDRKANVTVPIDRLIDSYAKWGAKLGIRYDVAFAQSIVETGYFSFPAYGQLTYKDNNFAGIGACDTCAHGWSFPSADTGVEAQLELLREYATAAPLPRGVPNVIGPTGVGGCCQTWAQLAGVWASSTVYGISIMTVYDKMLTWLIPQLEMSAGLIAPAAAAAKGPELAPLPGAPATKAAKPAGGPALAPAPATAPANSQTAAATDRGK
jgi:hypothetical protein